MTQQRDSSDHQEHGEGVHVVRTDPISRAVEAAVYAPIGVAAFVAEMGPDVVRMVVARGRAEVDVRHEQISGRLRHAKGAGEVAIAFGIPMLRKKVEERLAALRPAASPPPQPPRRPAPDATSNGHHGVVVEPTAAASASPISIDLVSVAEASFPGDTASASDERLAIPGYDALSASQVVERLAGLSGEELAAVREYEAGHRRRRTILGKIEQLSV